MFLQGIAYVDFLDKEHLEAAIRKNKHKLLSKKVSIAHSDPSKSKKNREAGTTSKGQGMLLDCDNIFVVNSTILVFSWHQII